MNHCSWKTVPTDGRLTKLRIGAGGATATATTLRNEVLGPTGVALSKGSFWIAEGQVSHLLDPRSGPPTLPFLVERQVAGIE